MLPVSLFWQPLGFRQISSPAAKMDVRQAAQTVSSLFSGQIALVLGKHFVADYKLFHRRRAQQRRVKVGMQLPMSMLPFSVDWNGAPCQPME
jgi:hypothetical protein